MNLPLIDAAEFFLNLKQAAGEVLPAVEEAPAEDGLLQALSEAAKSKLGLAIAYRVYSESLRDPSNSAIGEHFKEHSEDCLNDVDFFVRRSSVMSGGASLEGVESPPASGDLTEILQVLSAMEEANLSLMSELVVLLEGNPSKYEVEAMMAKDQHHLDDLTQHMPEAPELPSVEAELPSVEEAAPPAAPPGVIGPAKVATDFSEHLLHLPKSTGMKRVGQILSGSRANALKEESTNAFSRAKSKYTEANARGSLQDELGSQTRKSKRLRDIGDVLAHQGRQFRSEANAERAKQVGAIGGTAAAATGAVIGAKKLLSKKDSGKEKTSEMGAAAMGQHSPVAPPAPLNGAAAGQHPKLAGVPTAKGFGRVKEILSGSRVGALKAMSADARGAAKKRLTDEESLRKTVAALPATDARSARVGEKIKKLRADRVEQLAASRRHISEAGTERAKQTAAIGSIAAGAGVAADAGLSALNKSERKTAGVSAAKGLLPRAKEIISGERASKLWAAAKGTAQKSHTGKIGKTPDNARRLGHLAVGSLKEKAKQIGAIGAIAAAPTVGVIGAKKLMKELPSKDEKIAQRTYDVGGSKRDGKAYSMHTTPDDYELSQLISSRMDGDLRGVRGKAKNEGMLVGSGLGAVKGLKAGKGWGGGEVIRTGGGGGGTVIGTFGSGGKMPKGMGADIRENQGMIRDELRGQGIKIGGAWDQAMGKALGDRGITYAGQLASKGLGLGRAVTRLGGAGAVLGAGVGAAGGAVAGGPGHRLSGALGGAAVGGAAGGAAGAAGGAAFHRSMVNTLNKANTVSDPFKHVGPAAAAAAMGPKLGADKSDSELAETGRQRAVANLASGFTSDKHTSGERHGTLAGRLGGAAVGAGAGALASRGATLPVRLAAGMGGAVIGGSMGGQIGKTIGSDHDAEKFWANHKEAGAGSSAAKWLAAHPTAVGGVAGSAIGAAGGAVAGGPEHRLSGALGGAAVGGAAGATAGHVGGRLLRAAPSPAAAPVQLASGRPGTIMAGPLPSAHTAVPQNVSIGSSPTVIPSRAHSIGSSPTVIPSSSSSSSKMRNLTMEGGEEMAAQYRQMPEDLRNVVESTPLVRDHKMQPHNALGLLQSRGSWGPNWKGGTPPRVPNPAHESESAVARVLRQAAETKVGSVSHGDKEMSPVLGKRVIRNAKQVWDNAVKEAMGEEAPVEQYLQEEAAGRQAQEAAESDYLRQQLQQTSQQLEQTQAQAQEQEAQVGEMQGTIQQLQGQQAEQAQAADAAVQTARQTAEAAMSQSMQRSAELMKQTQLAAGLQNAAATMKEQLLALSQTPVPPATVGEAGELDAAAQQQVGQDQAMEEQAAMEEEAQMAAAQGAPSAAAEAPPAPPKTASLGRAMGGAGQVLSKAPSGVAGAVLGAGLGAGTNAMIRGGHETAFLQDAVRKLEQKHQGGFATGMALAEARMRAEQSSVMDQHPGKAALIAAARGARAGFAVDTTLRSIIS